MSGKALFAGIYEPEGGGLAGASNGAAKARP